MTRLYGTPHCHYPLGPREKSHRHGPSWKHHFRKDRTLSTIHVDSLKQQLLQTAITKVVHGSSSSDDDLNSRQSACITRDPPQAERYGSLPPKAKQEDLNTQSNEAGIVNPLDKLSQLDHKHCRLQDLIRLLDRKQLEKELRDLEGYSQFKRAAVRYGQLCGFDDWRTSDDPEDCDYDSSRLRWRLHDAEKVRTSGDVERMLHFIRSQLSRFLGDMDAEFLFHPFLHGTKKLIENYTDAICDLIGESTKLCLQSNHKLNRVQIATHVEEARLSFGKTALMCSGGGTFGMRHVGTIKCLFETGHLPRIISGSSAGAIVCAVLGSQKDSQLAKTLESFCHGDLKVFVGDDEEPGWKARAAYWQENGHRYDSKNLRRVMMFHLGQITFAEAYQITGRILNITISTGTLSDNVLNYVTAPNVLLWSAVEASCALPYTYKACQVHEKHPVTGDVKLFRDGTACVDGSIEGDIPYEALQEQFNVNHAIVAQVNPHVVPFLEDKSAVERRRSPTLVLFLDLVKKEAANWAHFIPFIGNEDTAKPHLASIIAQRYSGHITILPKDFHQDILKVLTNPTPRFMEDAKRKGERATWERVSIIENHRKIEKALEAASNAIRKAVYNEI